MTRTLTVEDVYRLRTAGDPQVSPDGRSIAFTVTSPDRDRDRLVSHIWVAGPDGAPVQWTRGEDGESSPRWSPDGARLAFLAARGEGAKAQVHLLDRAGGEARRVGEFKGGVQELAWSPDGSRLALVCTVSPETDDTEAAKAAPIHVRRLVYKVDGAGFLGEHRSHLFLLDVESGDSVQLTSGDYSAGAPAWSPDGRRLAFTAAMHDDRDLDLASHLFTIPAAGGVPERAVGGAWITALPVWVDEGRILVLAAPDLRAVLDSLYLVELGAGEPRHLLDGFDRNVMPGGPAYPGGRPSLTPARDEVVFCARIGGCTHVFRQGLDAAGPPVPVLGGEGLVVSGLSLSAAGAGAVVAGSPDYPGDVFSLDVAGGAATRLTDLNAELLDGAEIARPELRRFRAPDGTELQGYLWGAERGTPKPLLLNVHGGPHNAWTPALSAFELHHQELVARGWCVLGLNPRGSDGYGEAFMRAVVGGWGLNDEQDFLAAVDQLVADGIADSGRLAVTGYSYGGFMTSWLVGRTRRFGAAVAGGVVTNLASEYGTSDYGPAMAEMEYGAEPHTDRARLLAMSPVSRVTEIETPLLILHGQADDRCDLGQAEELFAALRRLRREVEMVVYPGASHLFPVAGRPSHQADYQSRLVAWVLSHTVPPATAAAMSAPEPAKTSGTLT